MIQEKILLLQIPKNSGSTLGSVFSKNYKDIYNLHWDDSNQLHQSKIAMDKIADSSLITGHYFYGLHKTLKDENYQYVTMLREPLSRTISSFFYLKNDSRYVKRNLELKKYLNNLSFKSFLSSYHEFIPNHEYINNGQVRFLSGMDSKKGWNEVVENDFVLAKEHLDSIFFGLTEEFDRSLLYFKDKLELKHIFYRRQRVTSRKLKVSDADLKLIKEINEYDIKLYNYGKKLFCENTAYIDNAIVSTWQKKNAFYQKFKMPISYLYKIKRKFL